MQQTSLSKCCHADQDRDEAPGHVRGSSSRFWFSSRDTQKRQHFQFLIQLEHVYTATSAALADLQDEAALKLCSVPVTPGGSPAHAKQVRVQIIRVVCFQGRFQFWTKQNRPFSITLSLLLYSFLFTSLQTVHGYEAWRWPSWNVEQPVNT